MVILINELQKNAYISCSTNAVPKKEEKVSQRPQLSTVYKPVRNVSVEGRKILRVGLTFKCQVCTQELSLSSPPIRLRLTDWMKHNHSLHTLLATNRYFEKTVHL